MIRKRSLYSLVFTIFNDSLGWGIVLTIFAPLLLNANSHFLAPGTTSQARNFYLGLLIASYPLTQFLFMPFLGAISDFFGRKKMLQWTIFAAGCSFVVSAIAIEKESLFWLFLSRILAGVFSSNAATVQAAIADISFEKEKTKNMALSGVAGGLAWIVGQPLGGLLSTSSYVSWGNFCTPFYFVAGLFFLNFFWVTQYFDETYVHVHEEKNDWKQEIKNLSSLSAIPHMSSWLLIAFLFFFGWGFFIVFYPALLVQRFSFNQASIGFLSGYLSIFWLLSSLALNRGVGKKWRPGFLTVVGLPLMGLLLMILTFGTSINGWYITFPLLALFGAAIRNDLFVVLSNLAGKYNQGKVFGVSQSLMSLGMFLSPLFSGMLAGLHESLPIAVGGSILLGCGAFALFYYNNKKSTQTNGGSKEWR